MSQDKSQRLAGNALAAASMVLWSTSFPATDIILQTWHPLATAIGRLGIGALGLLPLMWWQGNISDVIHGPWKKVFRAGGLSLGIATITLNVGMMYSNPVTAAVIVTMMPPIAFLLAVIEGEQRITVKWMVGIGLAVAGGTWASIHEDTGNLGFQGGEILLVVSVTCFAWYSRAVVRHLGMISTASATALTLFAGTLVSGAAIGLAQATGMIELYYEPTLKTFGLLFWIAAVANGYGMLLWFFAVSRIGVTISSFHQNLVPFYVMLMAVLLGGFVVLEQVYGALLVVGGVLVTQWPARRPKRAKKQPQQG
ncbi:MAG: DMT family transporter [Rhodospirillales bacterium]|jgi:drug/metabolite transporter (DMT)-like permease|nr:DMT family transporter [Rhodospirillales bacterium]MBT4041220.1 DMT family transporter [Rhodospirillales bacterium]MBT4626882.1 DMT family transporter [Rhodospirillales bacterium]MBT5350466.1 DMT family transporter [Rhodospirillales bacterium]MBT5519676.1 DMT family transporter [Rhodospirillales bacterium]